jgi:hypothetical protein
MERIADTLKMFDEVLESDSRWGAFVLRNRETGAIRNLTLRDRYSDIEAITLATAVPEAIREHFDTARNLLLYSWFVYRFIPVAELHAFSTVEYALRIKSGRPNSMLKELFKLAIEKKWIKDSGFHYYNVTEEAASDDESVATNPDINDAQKYCKILLDSFPYLRNELAHGSNMLHPGGLTTLAICADLINQLFDSENSGLCAQ